MVIVKSKKKKKDIVPQSFGRLVVQLIFHLLALLMIHSGAAESLPSVKSVWSMARYQKQNILNLNFGPTLLSIQIMWQKTHSDGCVATKLQHVCLLACVVSVFLSEACPLGCFITAARCAYMLHIPKLISVEDIEAWNRPCVTLALLQGSFLQNQAFSACTLHL